ncbi:MAG: phosphodiesterase [Bacilli bacterium]|nr:phosphodiesterase [Bacilli bacterium]
MRVFIVSDTHGRLEAVKKIAKRIDDFEPDRIIHLGDYLYNGPRNGVPDDYDPMACCEILNKYAEKIVGVRGNCDSRIDGMLLKFPLSDAKSSSLNGYHVNLFHGDLVASELFTISRGDIVMFGHTHVYMLKKEDGVTYLNPGSPSFPKNGNPPTYAVWEGKRIEIRDLNTGDIMVSLEL